MICLEHAKTRTSIIIIIIIKIIIIIIIIVIMIIMIIIIYVCGIFIAINESNTIKKHLPQTL